MRWITSVIEMNIIRGELMVSELGIKYMMSKRNVETALKTNEMFWLQIFGKTSHVYASDYAGGYSLKVELQRPSNDYEYGIYVDGEYISLNRNYVVHRGRTMTISLVTRININITTVP